MNNSNKVNEQEDLTIKRCISILEKNNKEAKKFFMQGTKYCTIELPTYFSFDNVLKEASKRIGQKHLKEVSKGGDLCSKNYPNVNYTLFTNKDGKYSWRPLQLINPILYVLLVNEITSKDNWDKITKKFKEFYNNEKIKSFDIPKESIDIKNNDKKSTIIEWWEEIEQESIKLSLKYNCILKTDITDCYGSIYTHTIPWAIHGEKKKKREY